MTSVAVVLNLLKLENHLEILSPSDGSPLKIEMENCQNRSVCGFTSFKNKK